MYCCHFLEYFNNAKDVTFDQGDNDRHAVSGDPMDVGAYRAPSLINVALTAPYMHDGRFKSLDEIIDFYSEGLVYSDYVHPLMKNVRQQGVQLNDEDKAALKSFCITAIVSSWVAIAPSSFALFTFSVSFSV